MSPGSVIGRGAVVRGNVRGEGSLEILGRVEGDVNVTGDVVLGESAVVRGNVTGVELSIAGTVQGDLRGSQSVLLERGARVVGDLSAPRIGVAQGALVRGTVRTDGEPALAGAPRRGVAIHAPRPVPAPIQLKPVVLREATKPAVPEEPEEETPTRERDSSPRERERPPAPVVPALGRGAKAKKKRREA
jgi:cytoskeletal protein CcmA (bactofilin family)